MKKDLKQLFMDFFIYVLFMIIFVIIFIIFDQFNKNFDKTMLKSIGLTLLLAGIVGLIRKRINTFSKLELIFFSFEKKMISKYLAILIIAIGLLTLFFGYFIV